MSTQQTSMEDLLSRRVVDEKERSPDDRADGALTDQDVPEAFEGREPFEDAQQQDQPQVKAEKPKREAATKAEARDDDDPSPEAESRRMSGLPKWAYLRLQANNQKADAAERRAAELEARLKALETRQQPLEQEDEQEETWDQWTDKRISSVKAEMEKQNWDQRNAFGWRLAVREHGEELPKEATAWANDRARADRNFAQQVYLATDPVDFCIAEFKKAQFAVEAEKFGWDLDKLAAARASKQQQNQQQPQPAAGASGVASQPQTEPRMPSDFASANTGAGRVNGDAGPTPLGDLLNLNTRRR